MNTPFDYLGALLDRLFEWNPIAGYLVAVAIAAVCTLVLARLNADGTSVAAFVTRPA
ncbi:hypothetical protein LGM75_24700 [Burkholderia multivorans]|jgi:hypothetical protein|uniref:hypothetical protein n=1 Tax=Burkholderia multivorans TaxID=87883 RepID=UPI001C2322DF|nr:hypothetical protein [Burkholderia multivorans]MBU9420603.1 hypothetical protein [Burkholderia multivorans]MBU9446895.1 hypothetical protein [Burkholderia multivorans]MBU9468621.1 hypothetical protein [Burkholderia multivorans]MBU9552472.1 hypothetical protein [Burkholderia multivorans]MCA8129557.1 hypothetical protein [Burkholderia multivorans]